MSDTVESASKMEIESETKKIFNIDSIGRMSKNKLKKLQRHKKWIEGKAERRRREREKDKERRAKRRQAAVDAGVELIKKPAPIKMNESICKVTIVIDCDYGQFMGEDLLRKFCKQVTRCYSENRASKVPVQLYFTSVSGNIKEAFETYQPGYKNWDCNVTENHWNDVFVNEKTLDKNNLIYLSGDSSDNPPELAEIQKTNNKVFIIGGLLDHNQHKGLSLKRAKSFGIKHAKLPISDHIKLCQRTILSIPHVFEIMMLAANGTMGQDWMDIFQKVIPARKIVCENEKKINEDVKLKNIFDKNTEQKMDES